MSRQQYQSHRHFGADDHSNRRGGTTRGGGRPDQQWRGDSGGERADYYASMEDERNFGSYGPYGDGGAEWSDERSGGNYYGRSANRAGGPQGNRGPSWGGNSEYGGYGDARGQYQQRDFNLYQDRGGNHDLERGARGYGFGQQSPESWPYGESSGLAYTDYSGDFPGVRRRGQMPKGYTRSDERIKDDLVDRLYHSSGIDLSDVGIEVKDGKVSLSGSVPERRMKHRIEDFCEHCIGVKDVDNQLRVNRNAGNGNADRQREQDMRKTASAASDARH